MSMSTTEKSDRAQPESSLMPSRYSMSNSGLSSTKRSYRIPITDGRHYVWTDTSTDMSNSGASSGDDASDIDGDPTSTAPRHGDGDDASDVDGGETSKAPEHGDGGFLADTMNSGSAAMPCAVSADFHKRRGKEIGDGVPDMCALLHGIRSKGVKSVLHLIPKDDNDQLTSAGSVMHQFGKCKQCFEFFSKKGCRNGVKCRFCHLQHDGSKPLAGYAAKKDRIAFRSFFFTVRHQMLDQPKTFDIEQLDWPEFTGTNSHALTAQLHKEIDRLRRKTARFAARGPSEGSA